MRSLSTHLAVLALGASLAGGVAAADVPRHEVPTWMRQTCSDARPVNCYTPGGSGESYVRQMPGREHLTCVFYVQRPRRDYCS